MGPIFLSNADIETSGQETTQWDILLLHLGRLAPNAVAVTLQPTRELSKT
jgi:hypothetical protein